MNMTNVLLVGLGGCLGSVARYISVKSIDEKLNAAFPYGTLTVNLVGSFIVGMVYAYLMRKTGASEGWRLFLGAGFCGGFTTFSAFAWENLELVHNKMATLSLIYIAASLVGGLLMVGFGAWCSRFF